MPKEIKRLNGYVIGEYSKEESENNSDYTHGAWLEDEWDANGGDESLLADYSDMDFDGIEEAIEWVETQ